MTDIVLSPINTDDLINRIAARTAELIQSGQSATPDPGDDLITPKQASELLQCSLVTLWRWEKIGRVKPWGIGGKKFFKRSELLESLTLKK